MAEESPGGEERRYEQLNLLGQVVRLGGEAVRLTAKGVDYTLQRTARIAADTEKAFRQGRDENVEDAQVLEEWEKSERQR